MILTCILKIIFIFHCYYLLLNYSDENIPFLKYLNIFFNCIFNLIRKGRGIIFVLKYFYPFIENKSYENEAIVFLNYSINFYAKGLHFLFAWRYSRFQRFKRFFDTIYWFFSYRLHVKFLETQLLIWALLSINNLRRTEFLNYYFPRYLVLNWHQGRT